MKKLLLSLACIVWSLPVVQAATITVSNYNGFAVHGVADSTGTLVGDNGGHGVIGRMTISDTEIQDLIAAKDFVALEAAFEVFAPGAGAFSLGNLEAGAFEAELSASTVPGETNAFADSDIYIWLYTGNNRSSATNYLLAKLPYQFPEDPASGPPAGPVEVFLRPTATFFAGAVSEETHDYGLGDGAVAILQMEVQDHNQAPEVENLNITVVSGGTVSGQVVATDADEDELTFEKVSDPTMGSVDFDTANGTFTYTANAGITTQVTDSFTFKAFDGTIPSAEGTVNITINPAIPEAPVIDEVEPVVGYVGTSYEYQIKIANLPQGQPTSYIASGLPAGLKLDAKTGAIKGIPSKAYESGQTAQISAKNATGTGPKQPITFVIKSVPVEAIGTFVARVERASDNAADLGGRIDLTTSSKGSFTAKLMAGTLAYAGKGYMTITEEDSEPVVNVSIQFLRKGAPTLEANLTLDLSQGPGYAEFQLLGSLSNPAIEQSGVDVKGVRNTWTKLDQPTAFMGAYTYSLTIPEEDKGDETIPQGTGFGALTVTNKGTASFTGKTADGKPFTVATIIGRQGDIPLYCALAGGAGSLVSIPEITTPGVGTGNLNGLSGIMSWSKPEGSTKERAYRDGFGKINLTLSGGLYQGAPVGGIVAGLVNTGPTDMTAKNAWISFSEGGLADGDIETFSFLIMNRKVTSVGQTVVVAKPNPKAGIDDPNPNSISFKLLSKPAGYFTGSFVIPNAVKSNVRKVTYQGTFVRHPDGSFDRVGYFLLPELPDVGEKITTTPMLSGQVLLSDSEPESDPEP
ncbi:hypothetical protein SAMN02745166_04526 [Prosthecobacter debontii]|uniref:Uncharacterized protein n=1 Tax=Prosthecobacter debontii TaxID=48467 RepID=A0A1T4YYM3_9BACT|nr:Ig-like domain-containing protein [Prosthecobacter debontii]SKB06743.1 hypothetical protein SAMN02745166_04526 [Prosthecobacter debontii]